jgi:predicted amidohydrolase
MTEITVRAVQFAPVLGDVDANAETIRTALVDASDDGVDLLAVPELALTGYHIGHERTDALVDEAADALAELRDVAPDVTAVVGTPVAEGDRLYNSAVVLDGGERVGTYHKTHLYGDEEAAVFDAGESFPVTETSAGAVGVQICYDVEFPEVSRQLARADAEVIVTVSANMRPFQLDQRTYHRARAMENVRPHLLCNRTGEERGVDFFGESGVVDERGRDVVRAGADRTMTVTGSVDLAATGEETLQYFRDRRPEIYE